MADKKISQLTAASLPLAGSEVLPIVQSSTTVKVAADDLTVKNIRSNATTGILQVAGPAAAATRTMTVPDANFTAARTDAAQTFTGDQTLGTGNLVMGTAAKGIDFSINPSAAGMTSELLNDYEEGTWTPLVRGTSTAGTYELQNAYGKYVKVGDLLMIEAYIQLASVITGGGTGNLGITGLPFGKPANAYPTGAAYVANVTITVSPIMVFGSFGASTTLLLQQNASGGFGTSVAIGDVTAGDYISFSMTYRTT